MLVIPKTFAQFRCFVTCVGDTIAKQLDKHLVTTQVIPKPTHPIGEATVSFLSGARVNFGNELTPTQVQHQPLVSWKANKNDYYLLCLTDPDTPSMTDPTDAEWVHWLIGNIPGSKIARGELLAEYIGALPERGTGLHRYVLLIYKQRGRICFRGPRLKNNNAAYRSGFSICRFAGKYKLGDPVAVNFFQAAYDPHTQKLRKRIGLYNPYMEY